jgi:hypothetical protein
MQTGRPLLVVPDACDWLDLRSVLIAWKDTPECRRAVVDALPICTKPRTTASRVPPLGVSKEFESRFSGEAFNGPGEASWLVVNQGLYAFPLLLLSPEAEASRHQIRLPEVTL